MLIDVMYELPSMKDVTKCVIEPDTVTKDQWPILLDAEGNRLDTKLPPKRQAA
jgi:ATP-dependent protease Clp ATPase subunit